jgi:acyl-CoA reductase-like NAD-dependent aldehyde dehydrogenase
VDVQSRVRQIFDSSVRALEQTLQIGDTAKQLRMAEARKPLLDQRERVIKDIQAAVKQLGGTLAALQRMDTGGATNHELSRLRDELDQSLEIASRVEARLSSLLDQTETDVRSTPPPRRAVNHQKGN